MRISHLSSPLTQTSADLIAIPVVQGRLEETPAVAELDGALGGVLVTAAKEEGFIGKADSRCVLHTHGKLPCKRVALFGMGEDKGLGEAPLASARHLGARVFKAADGLKAATIGLVPPALPTLDAGQVAAALGEGALLGGYRFERYKTKDVEPSPVVELGLFGTGVADTLRADVVTTAVCVARDLVNEPAVRVTPAVLAETAQDIATRRGLACRILDKAGIQAEKMNLLLAVSAGSEQEPRFIHLTYTPPGADPATCKQVALVGKGLTFDAGGYTLKPVGSIEDMKMDMAGGAAVLAAMDAIGQLAPQGVIVHGIVPSSENLISGAAYKLGDVFTARNGKTVEILNCDAEGRLILADALSYAVDLGVDAIVDLATLTGACVIALGNSIAGLFGNDEDWASQVSSAGREAGEEYWRLPLSKPMRPMLKSEIADMKNVGERWGGAITAALFLEEFVGGKPWVHLDIAGPAHLSKSALEHIPKGGTGFGVLTLVRLVERLAR